MTWYTAFGLEQDPFSIDPFSGKYTMVNYTDLVEDVIYAVKAGQLFVLEGEPGTGKTTILRQIIRMFGGQGRVLYIDGAVYNQSFDIEQIMDEKGRGFFKKLRGHKPNRLIVLLDNADCLSAINMQKLKYYYDHDYVQSVIFSTRCAHDLSLSASILDRLGSNTRRIPPMINYDALRIIRDRFPDHFFLPDEIVLKLFSLSNKNIKQLLVNCGIVCAYVVKQGKGEVLPKYIRLALQSKKKASSETVQQHGKKAVSAHD